MKTYNLKHSTLSAIFADLENGNLSDAKKRAKRASTFRLSMFARQILCWSFERSTAAAAYLKGKAPFQQFCDAE
jgi:hypothetical protein